jgi:hypothetical protein
MCLNPGKSIPKSRHFQSHSLWTRLTYTQAGTFHENSLMTVRSQLSRRDLLKYMGVAGLGLRANCLVGAASPTSAITFVDVGPGAGITLQQEKPVPESTLIETMGRAGWIDYDQNGLLDLYFVTELPLRVQPKSRCAARFTGTTETAALLT